MRWHNQPRLVSAAWALLVCVVVLLGAGCKRRTVQAAPPVIVSQPAAEPEPAKPAPEPKPETTAPVNPEPAPVKPATKPTSTRVTAPKPTAPAPEPTEAAPPRPAAPQISPRMSPEQQAVHQKKTSEAISTAERNLQKSYGRKLNAAQLDMVEKIRGFLAQSREAANASDWARALNLAQKAQVLSEELVGSL